MTTDDARRDVALLLQILDQAFDKRSWHGPNLRSSIRGLTPAEAAWRPRPSRKSIADHVVHAAYWKYAARRRLRGDKRGSFPLKGSNWFPLPAPLSDTTWRELVALLDGEHRALREAVAELRDVDLARVPPDSKVTHGALVAGVAAHDVYHAGQIQLLKRLQE